VLPLFQLLPEGVPLFGELRRVTEFEQPVFPLAGLGLFWNPPLLLPPLPPLIQPDPPPLLFQPPQLPAV